jgi:hypothetical protein
MEQILQLRTDKYTELTKSLAYYDSTRNPVYLNRRLLAFFNANPHYKMNILATIVDAVKNKLIIDGFVVGTPVTKETGEIIPDPRNDKVSLLWDNGGLSIEADTLHEYIHATGEGFMVCGLDDNDKPVAHAADPRACVAYYGSADPKEITQAAYFWLDGEIYKATVWATDDGGKVSEQTFTGIKRTASTETPETTQTLNYSPDGDAIQTNYPRIPVFHFRRTGRNITSEFYQVKDIQDSINKAFVAQGFAIENAADAVTYVIANSGVEELSNARAGDAVAIPPAPQNSQPVEVGQIPAADFGALGKVIDDGVNYAMSITATPRHYFGNVGASISGEALQAMEAPLVSKVMRYIRRHAAMFEQLIAFLLTVGGDETQAEEVTCNYADPHTVLTVTQAQARLTNTQAGIPIETQLRMEGWREDDINQLVQDRDNAQPVELSEQIIEQANEKAAQKSATDMKPMMEEALNLITEAALAKITQNGTLERLTQATPKA